MLPSAKTGSSLGFLSRGWSGLKQSARWVPRFSVGLPTRSTSPVAASSTCLHISGKDRPIRVGSHIFRPGTTPKDVPVRHISGNNEKKILRKAHGSVQLLKLSKPSARGRDIRPDRRSSCASVNCQNTSAARRQSRSR